MDIPAKHVVEPGEVGSARAGPWLYPEATFLIASPDPRLIEAIGGDGLLRADGIDRISNAEGRPSSSYPRSVATKMRWPLALSTSSGLRHTLRSLC